MTHLEEVFLQVDVSASLQRSVEDRTVSMHRRKEGTEWGGNVTLRQRLVPCSPHTFVKEPCRNKRHLSRRPHSAEWEHEGSSR